MAIVKVENNGIEQSVHLPKEYHLNSEEVFINKIGEIITLAPISSLKKYYDDGCNMLTDDFLADGIPEGIWRTCTVEGLYTYYKQYS